MGAGVSQQVIKRHLNKLAKQYSGVEFRVLRASNGETAILPVNPQTDEAEMANPQKFVVKNLWVKMCQHDGVDPTSNFVAFSDSNPWTADYNNAMAKLQKGR